MTNGDEEVYGNSHIIRIYKEELNTDIIVMLLVNVEVLLIVNAM